MHVRPTNHLYFNIKFVSQSQNSWLTERVNVVAPGNLTIYQISSNNISPTHTDYQLYLSSCSSFYVYFDHITGLSQALQSLFVAPFDSCHGYSGSSGQSCTKIVRVLVQAGQYLGTAGGVQNGSTALDVGAVDFRVPPLAFAVPAHYRTDQAHAVCAIDYYTPSVADKLRSLLGSYDGSVRRTIPPVCGSVNQDVQGTAQGSWYSQGSTFPVDNESQTIALVHDNVNASRGVFSIGSSMTNLGFRGGPYYFSPRSTGLVNLDFQYVKPGQAYCYETSYNNRGGNSGPNAESVILVEVLNATTMRIEDVVSASSCGVGPWTFTANQTDFQR
jgi:hypothetical protein